MSDGFQALFGNRMEEAPDAGKDMRIRGIRMRRAWLKMAVICGLFFAFLWMLAWVVSLPEDLNGPLPESPVITDRNGVPMARLTLPSSQRASPVPFEAMPPDLIACTLAAEDKRFWKHGGVDVLATLRASRDLVWKRRVVSGASTITQQLIKIMSPPERRTVWRKAYEALAAIQLERRWTKRDVLSAYLNRLDYGNRSIGAAEAARFYFQKPLADLSLAECALLAGLPQGPSALNPVRHPQRALARRQVVLDRLEATGLADPERIRRARAEPVTLHPLQPVPVAPWLRGVALPEGAVGRVRSTLDASLQKDVEAIVREEVARLRDSNLRHAALRLNELRAWARERVRSFLLRSLAASLHRLHRWHDELLQSAPREVRQTRPLLDRQDFGDGESGDEESAGHAPRRVSTARRPVMCSASLAVKLRQPLGHEFAELVLDRVAVRPHRPIGVRSTTARAMLSFDCTPAVILVSIHPGAIAFTRGPKAR